MSKMKACSLCFKPIDEGKKYSVFKHNQLFKLSGPHDVWTCLTKHYVCGDCLTKLQEYCNEGMFANEDIND